MKKVLLLIFICLTVLACKTKISSEKEYFKWINNPDNHCSVTKIVGDLSLNVKYLHPEYLVAKEFQKGMNKDSLLKLYKQSRTFIFTLKIEGKDESKDILYYKSNSPQAYTKRLDDLYFNIVNYISLKTDKKEYQPVLYTFENNYGLAPGRAIYLVFAENENKSNELLLSKSFDLIFNDVLFNTGINHFHFEKSALDDLLLFNLK